MVRVTVTEMVRFILKMGMSPGMLSFHGEFPYPAWIWWKSTRGQVIAPIDRGVPIVCRERQMPQHMSHGKESRMMALLRCIATMHFVGTRPEIKKIL